VSPICSILRGSFEDYQKDALPAPQRKMLREHLSACAECREQAIAQEPAFLFARPLREEVGAPEAERILASVRTGVALMETERRIRSSRRRFAGSAAAAAAVAALVLLTPVRGGRNTQTLPLPLPLPAAGGPVAVTRIESPAPPDSSLAAAEPAANPAEATVYEWNPGAGREEPRVVWIVDRGLDI
jgi:hypothetical protein